MIETPLLALLLATALAPSPSPVPSPSDAPVTTPSPSAAVPSAAIESTPSTMPSSSPAPAALPTASPYKYRFVPRQPAHPVPGAPQIFAVYLNDKTLRSRGPILIKVETDPGTIKVTSRSNGREGIVPKIAPGDFEAASTLPKIPFIAAGITTYLDFVATSASGLKTTVRVPIGIE